MRPTVAQILLLGILLPGSATRAQAQDGKANGVPSPIADTGSALHSDKSDFTLFSPTPDSMMREFNTDRPDATESPYTVDAGHMQLEFSFLEYTRNSSSGTRGEAVSVLPANLKIGLLKNLDLQLVLNPYLRSTSRSNGSQRQNRSGFGDVELRTKINFWGNDGGATAGGIMPFVRLPGGSGGDGIRHVEGGIILPFASELPAGFDVGTMAEFDADRNSADDGYGVDFVHSVTLGHSLGRSNVHGYVEYFGTAPIATGSTYGAYFDTGATISLSENLQVDGGVNIGLPSHGSVYTVFSGLSTRF